MSQATRLSVKQGICAYFGGTQNVAMRCWQNGPLTASGLGTVKGGWPKEFNDADYTFGMAAGRNMGAIMIVHLAQERETQRSNSGQPVTSGGVVVQGGIKFDRMRVTLHVFHMSEAEYGEDSADDVDSLLEAIKQYLRNDPTLGQICTQAGKGRFGIQTVVNQPGIDDNERYKTYSTVKFEILVQALG